MRTGDVSRGQKVMGSERSSTELWHRATGQVENLSGDTGKKIQSGCGCGLCVQRGNEHNAAQVSD